MAVTSKIYKRKVLLSVNTYKIILPLFLEIVLGVILVDLNPNLWFFVSIRLNQKFIFLQLYKLYDITYQNYFCYICLL